MFDEEEERSNPLERVISRERDAVEKTACGVFGYTAGKSIIAARLVKMFPAHKAYTEAFCGSAAMFFVKEAVPVEVLADTNKDVVFAHKAMKTLSKADLAQLAKKNWTSSRGVFMKLLKSSPTDKLDRLYKFLYLARFSFGKRRNSYSPNTSGETAQTAKRVAKFQSRYKGATIVCADYETVVKKYDGKDAFHFMDPPYVGYDAGLKEKDFDEKRLRKVMESLKGRFLVTYGVKGNLETSGFEVKRMRQRRTIGSSNPGNPGSSTLSHLLITNFKMAKKSLGPGVELDDVMQVIDTDDGGERIMVTGSRTSVSVPEDLTPARAWKHEDLLRAYPEAPGPIAGEARLRFLEKACELDLTFPVNGQTVGWSLAVQRADIDALPAHVAKSFCVEGSRFFRPLTRGVPARETPADSLAQAVVKIDRPDVELGLQTKFLHEYFLSKGDELVGQLVVERDRRLGDEHPWLATLVGKGFVPIALTKGAPMPPQGVSALTESLEKIVPPAFRYWEHHGEKAILMRDALAASGFFGEGSLAIVDGQAARVVTKFELYESASGEAPSQAEWRLAKVLELVPDGIQGVVEVDCRGALEEVSPGLLAKASDHAGRVIYVDAGGGADGVLDLLKATLSGHAGHYVVTAEDSPAARASFSSYGRPFQFRPGGAVGADAVKRLFVASFGVRSDEVCWLDKAEEAAEGAEWLRRGRGAQTKEKGDTIDKTASPRQMLETVGPPNEWSGAVAAAIGPEQRQAMKDEWEALPPAERAEVQEIFERGFDRSTATTKRSIQVVKAEEDEHFVFGVVLEPDTVDAQKDVYSAAEVRQAAHRYMAEFQNRGLMHKELVNGKVDILESFISPADFTMGSQTIKRGTWLMAVRVKDAKLWKEIKEGGLTGFSIGGSANRQVDAHATSKYNARKDVAKKKIAFQGIPIVIDRPRGSVQRGVGPDGKEWSREYKTDYGYIPRTKGGDGDGLDVFVGPKDDSPTAFWVTQQKTDGTFDEFKLVLGVDSQEEAKKIYLAHVPEKFFAAIREGSVQQIRALLNQEPDEPMQKAIQKLLGV